MQRFWASWSRECGSPRDGPERSSWLWGPGRFPGGGTGAKEQRREPEAGGPEALPEPGFSAGSADAGQGKAPACGVRGTPSWRGDHGHNTARPWADAAARALPRLS